MTQIEKAKELIGTFATGDAKKAASLLAEGYIQHNTGIADGLPDARVIDIMLADSDSLYFITAKGKRFYRQLMEQKFAAISGMTSGESLYE